MRAQVKKGYTPVIGAKVEVQVGSLPWKPMKDDGLGKSNKAEFSSSCSESKGLQVVESVLS